MRYFFAWTAVAALAYPTFGVPQATDTLRVTVHNHEVVLYRTGHSGPIVVLEAGGGSSHRVWNSLVPQLAKHAVVLTYDRPGYGLSAPFDSPRTALRIARELNEALRLARVGRPFHLGGWSLGGSIVRTFAGEFRQSVGSLLLIDPAPEEFYARAQREFPDLWTLEEEQYFPVLFKDSSRRAEHRELAGYGPSMEQARASDEKHAVPTLLLIAGRNAEAEPDPISQIWIDELKRWGARRPATTVQIIPRVGHHIARDNPDAVVEAFLAFTTQEVRRCVPIVFPYVCVEAVRFLR